MLRTNKSSDIRHRPDTPDAHLGYLCYERQTETLKEERKKKKKKEEIYGQPPDRHTQKKRPKNGGKKKKKKLFEIWVENFIYFFLGGVGSEMDFRVGGDRIESLICAGGRFLGNPEHP